MFVKANLESGDKYYIAGHIRAISCLNQVLFACNNEYCINEKKAVKIIDTFEFKPEDYSTKVNRVFDFLGDYPLDCYALVEELYNEIGLIVARK